MKGPSRAAARTGWVGGSLRRSNPSTRECPKCPARTFEPCRTWVNERYTNNVDGTFQGDGRWSAPLTKGHIERLKPDGNRWNIPIDTPRMPCGKTVRHGYHWHTRPDDAGDSQPRVWCRGAL